MTRNTDLRPLFLAAACFFAATSPALASFPPEPPGLAVATTSVANTTPSTIPVTGIITSSVVVSGAGTSIWDVDATTFIRHGSNSELQITLTAPSGKVVTLTSNPFNDETDEILANVLNGTLWDDQANPSGQVPYLLNPGNGNDHDYASGTLAPRLTPSEALGALRGENPNGTWTLTIRDAFQLEVDPAPAGTLDRWSLAIATLSPVPPFTPASAANATVQAISSTGTPTISSTVEVQGALGRIYDLDVRTFIPHTNSADIDMTLRSPAGTVVTLTTDTGAVFDNVFNGTTWDDQANPGGSLPFPPSFPGDQIGTNNGVATDHLHANNVVAARLAPEEPLSAFNGEDANGTWTLTISDDRELPPGFGGGQLTSWSLDFDLVGSDGVVGGGPPLTSVTNVPALGWPGALALALALAAAGLVRTRRLRA